MSAKKPFDDLHFPNTEDKLSARKTNATALKVDALFDYSGKLSALQALEQEFSELLGGAINILEFEKLVLKVVNRLGFSDFSYISLISTPNTVGNKALTLSSLLTSYRGEGAYSGTLLQAVVANTRNRHLAMAYHVIASTPFDTELLTAPTAHLLIASTGNDDYHIVIDSPLKGGRYTTVSEGQQFINNHRTSKNSIYALDVLANITKCIGTNKFPSYFSDEKANKRSRITQRPLSLLNTMVQKDVSLNQAASILDISIDTANKHIAAAKAALGTKTLPGTIWAAIQMGLIEDGNF